MELLGEDLESLLNLCGRRLTLKTLLILVEQTVKQFCKANQYVNALSVAHPHRVYSWKRIFA